MRTLAGILGARLCSVALAQAPAKAPRIGVLHNGSQASTAHLTEAFVRGLAEFGYHDGRNVALEYRYAEGRFDRLPALSQDLAAKRVEILRTALPQTARFAVLVIENPMFFANRGTIAALAAKERLPAINRASDYALAGGLTSYGANYADLCRRAASYVDRIQKGAKPGDLPIEQPVKFERVINLKAAKAIGVAIPRELLLRAEQVLE